LGQTLAEPGIAPEPEQPGHCVQKMQPALCGIALRWTLPEPPHWEQAFCDGAAVTTAGVRVPAPGRPPNTGGVSAMTRTGTPQWWQKLLFAASGVPQDEQKMGGFLRMVCDFC